MSNSPPTSIGRFEVIQQLGAGSYGDVYLGMYDGIQYAIKRVSFNEAIETMNEISLYTIMSHPHIMKPYEYIPSDDYREINILMPKVKTTLGNYIIDSILDEVESKLLTWQLLSALDYMHTNGIIHRDLKPGNILMDSMDARIIDFGLSKYVHATHGRMSSAIQTYTYRSPEVFMAGKDVNQLNLLGTAMDVWSLGIMVIEMIQGKFLFESMGLQESDVAGLVTDYKYISHVIGSLHCSRECKDVLRMMLQVDPKRRYSCKDLMSMPWFSEYVYQAPDRISIPTVQLTNTEYIMKVKGLMMDVIQKCRYNDQVFDYAIKLFKVIHEHDKGLFTNGNVVRLYMGILLKVASASVQEYVYLSNTNCRIYVDMDKISGEDLYDTLKMLNFNIIIQ